MLARLSDMAERQEPNRRLLNILTLDGGGIRGLVILQV